MPTRQSKRAGKGGKSNRAQHNTGGELTRIQKAAATFGSVGVIIGGCYYAYIIGHEALLHTGLGYTDLFFTMCGAIFLVAHLSHMAHLHGWPVASVFTHLAPALWADLINGVRGGAAYFWSTKLLWGMLALMLVMAGLSVVLVPPAVFDDELVAVASPAPQADTHKAEQPVELSKPAIEVARTDITAGWPLPLAPKGVGNPPSQTTQPPRSGGGARHPKTKLAQPLHLHRTIDSDQNMTSYSHAPPLRYPCVSSFLSVMTPIELLVCGLPLVIAPMQFPVQPSPRQFEQQAPLQSSRDGIY